MSRSDPIIAGSQNTCLQEDCPSSSRDEKVWVFYLEKKPWPSEERGPGLFLLKL